MGRNELCITVPNLFRCPISLDVMKSPVSLCTGVTYDRSNIQHWLDSGHDTCPATMQVLSTTDFVPNLTLRRLINLWSAQSSSSSARSPVPEHLVTAWIDDIKALKAESLLKVVKFLTYSDENRRFLARFDGFVEANVAVLSRGGEIEIRIVELVVRVLNLILGQNGVKEKVQRLVVESGPICPSSLLSVIQNCNSSSKTEAVNVLDVVSVNDKAKCLVAETENLIPVLHHLVKTENDSALHCAVLSLLINIAKTRAFKTQFVQLGLVQVLSKNASDRKAAISVVENSLKLLSILSECAEGRTAISEDAECAECIVERLMKVSKTATENAILVLWSLCCVLRDGRVQEKVVRSNGLTKVLLVMQSEVGEGAVRKICGDLVKVLSVGCKNNGGFVMSYDTKTTHIMPC